MANRVAPKVRLLFACDDALQLSDGRWVLTNPWAVLDFPPGVTRFDQPKIWFYVQLAEGVGEFELTLQMRHFEASGMWTVVGQGKIPIQMDFKGAEQLRVFQRPINLTKVPPFTDLESMSSASWHSTTRSRVKPPSWMGKRR